jgi:hypothetical protein
MREDRATARIILARILPKFDGPRLPFVVWARLLFDLTPFLYTRHSNGMTLLCVFHKDLQGFLESEYLSLDERLQYHYAIADYFERQPRWILGKQKPTRNARRESELEYHHYKVTELSREKVKLLNSDSDNVNP